MDVPILRDLDPAILIFKLVPLFGTPIVVGIAWWTRFRAERTRPMRWRATALLIALVAASANALLFYSWFAYDLIFDETLLGRRAHAHTQRTLEDIAVYLIFAAAVGAVVGKGQGRILTVLVAIMGFLLWVPAAFL